MESKNAVDMSKKVAYIDKGRNEQLTELNPTKNTRASHTHTPIIEYGRLKVTDAVTHDVVEGTQR